MGWVSVKFQIIKPSNPIQTIPIKFKPLKNKIKTKLFIEIWPEFLSLAQPILFLLSNSVAHLINAAHSSFTSHGPFSWPSQPLFLFYFLLLPP
jgi:hypothetical protein